VLYPQNGDRIVNIEQVTSFHPLYRPFFDSPNAFSGRAPSGPTRELLDPVVDRVGRNDRLGCFFYRLDRLHRLVDDFTTRLDLADFLSTWSTCGHFDHNFLLVHAHWQLTRKILVSKHLMPSHSQFQVEGLAFFFSFHPLIFS